MIIALDLGNTALTVGIYESDRLRHRFYTMTDLSKTSDEYRLVFQSFFLSLPASYSYEAIVFSSVVPPLTNVIKEALGALTSAPVVMIGRKVKTGLALHVDHPSEVGSDLVAASVAGISKYGAPLVIADLGTASKVIAIDKTGAFVGVTIAPGLMIAHQALIGRASQLSEVELEIPKTVIGRNTVHAVNSGSLYGHASLVRGLAAQVGLELGTDKPVLLTGGFAKQLRPLLADFIYDENLLLDGLIRIYHKHMGGK